MPTHHLQAKVLSAKRPNESSRAEVTVRKIPNESPLAQSCNSSQTKAPKRTFASESSQARSSSQANDPNRKCPREGSLTNAFKQRIASGTYRAKVPKRQFQTNDNKLSFLAHDAERQLLVEGSHTKVPTRTFPIERSHAQVIQATGPKPEIPSESS